MASLKIENIIKRFSSLDHDTIKNLSLDINDGEFVVFVGPSGCGKSTLLRMIAGLEEVTDGNISLDNQDITDVRSSRRNMAMVFQSYALYPHMDVRQNMAFALKLAKADPKEIDNRVTKAAEMLGLTEYLGTKPKNLSGGQRQRVAIGRAIVREPQLFLFDEPLSNLDATLRVQTRIELSLLHKRLKTTMIYVTHDQVEAMTLAERIVVLRDGVIEQVGSPDEIYKKPNNLFVAGFIGVPKMSFLKTQIKAVSSKSLSLILNNQKEVTLPINITSAPLKVSAGDVLTLGIRPENLIPAKIDSSSTASAIEGEIQLIENLGSDTFLHVKVGSETLTARIQKDSTFEAGETVRLIPTTEKAHLFNSSEKNIFIKQ